MFNLLAFFSLFFILLIILSVLPQTAHGWLRQVALLGTILIFAYSLGLWLEFNPYLMNFQQVIAFDLFRNYTICFGFDGLSLLLVILTTFLFPLCLLMSWVSVQRNLKYYLILFVLLEFLLVSVFLCLDFFLFYLLFEFSLIPMFLLIGVWGAPGRKTKAAYYLFLYTLFGSLFMLLALIYLLLTVGTTNYFNLVATKFCPDIQKVLWPAIFLAFAIKIPMFPFHIWLPEAHVEAPTAGSVLLAGIVLKLGGYGMIRFLLPILPYATHYYAPLATMLALMGATYAALTALRQLDMKRIIAYSSIAHMNFGLLGLFSLTCTGWSGFIYLMLGHGFISSALFFLVGVVYDRYHSRLYSYYNGLAVRMPLFAFAFFFFTISNVAFPGTFNFVSELLVLCGIAQTSLTILFFSGLSLFFSTIFSFWLFNRVCFGTLNVTNIAIYVDLRRIETYLFISLAIPVLLGGLFPTSLMTVLSPFLFSHS